MLGSLFSMYSDFDVLVQSSSVPPWNILCDYTMLQNNYTSRYLFWSNLSAIIVVFSWYFMKVFRKWLEEASIFNKLHVDENIHEGFSFSTTLKADFCNNVLLQIFSLVESSCIEIRVLLSANFLKLLQVS